jgi:hypothetical protein
MNFLTMATFIMALTNKVDPTAKEPTRRLTAKPMRESGARAKNLAMGSGVALRATHISASGSMGRLKGTVCTHGPTKINMKASGDKI